MKKILFILFVVFTSSLFSQNEFLVNSNQDSTQRAPRIAGPDQNGNYVITWQSTSKSSEIDKQDIFMQMFDKNNNKIGKEILVNDTTAGEQENPSVAMGKDGTVVIVWASFNPVSSEYGFDIKAKIYKNGIQVLPEFLVNKTRVQAQNSPDVSIDKNGNLVIVWESWFQDGSDRGVFGQGYSSDGKKSSDEFQINTTVLHSQARPCVRHFSDGRFIVSWESWINDTDCYDIYAQVFNSDGTKSKQEFKVNQYSADYQWFSNIAINSDDSFAISWCSWEQDGDDGGIYLQRYNSDCSKLGSEILVNSTTAHYQWLPKIKYLSNGRLASVWSSWTTDGSREGVYYCIIDQQNRFVTPETRVNIYTDNYQWEPDFIVNPSNELVFVWSSWGQYLKDYDIIARKIIPDYVFGKISERSVLHTQGKTTSEIKVNVLEPSNVTGNDYEISFDSLSSNLVMNIKNLANGSYPVKGYVTTRGENTFYITDKFDGISVELNQVHKVELDTLKSMFFNNSGSNVMVRISPTLTGFPLIAPVDIALIWGKTDTLQDGSYQFPLDTAYNSSMQKGILIPFKAYNLTDNKKVEVVVNEKSTSKNKRWDVGETLLILTPPEYRNSPYNTHAQITINQTINGITKLPSSGDTILVKTKRPLTSTDKFTFSTKQSDQILSAEKKGQELEKYWLAQNYPNPFNPVTVLRYHIPVAGNVELKIFDLLGREIKTLVKAYSNSGDYTVQWKGDDNLGNHVSSGIYIYRIQSGNYIQSKKMVLLR